MIPDELKLSYKMKIGFTEQQHQAFIILRKNKVNVNKMIRTAIAKELKLQWKNIKQKRNEINQYF